MFIQTKFLRVCGQIARSVCVCVAEESCKIKGFPCDLQVLSGENSGDQQQHIDFLVQQ